MRPEPRLSVVIPTHNRARMLAEAVASVRAQDYDDVEILIADDASDDDTPERATSFGPGVEYIRLPRRGGPAVARNAALRHARGDVVAFLDSDDVFLPGKFRLQLAALDAHPEVGLVYSDGVFFRDDVERPIGGVLAGLPRPSGTAVADLLRGNFLFPPLLLVRRHCLATVGCFDESLYFAQDYDLWLRVAARVPFLYVEGTVAAIRRHAGSVSEDAAAVRGDALLALAKMDRAFPELMRQHNSARCEGYARTHGAIAYAALRRLDVSRCVRHSLRAAVYFSRLPGRAAVIADWWRRRGRRWTAQP